MGCQAEQASNLHKPVLQRGWLKVLVGVHLSTAHERLNQGCPRTASALFWHRLALARSAFQGTPPGTLRPFLRKRGGVAAGGCKVAPAPCKRVKHSALSSVARMLETWLSDVSGPLLLRTPGPTLRCGKCVHMFLPAPQRGHAPQ